jgi:hypothetical protein
MQVNSATAVNATPYLLLRLAALFSFIAWSVSTLIEAICRLDDPPKEVVELAAEKAYDIKKKLDYILLLVIFVFVYIVWTM